MLSELKKIEVSSMPGIYVREMNALDYAVIADMFPKKEDVKSMTMTEQVQLMGNVAYRCAVDGNGKPLFESLEAALALKFEDLNMINEVALKVNGFDREVSPGN